MAVQPRVVHSKHYGNAGSFPLTGMPGAIAGLAIGVVFLTLATGMRFNTIENIMIMVLVTVMSATFFGLIAHLLGEALVSNEEASSTTQFFHGSVKMAKLAHSLFWVVGFFVISGMLAVMNPQEALKLRERSAASLTVAPEQTPIPIPPSPAGSRRGGQRTLAQSGNMEDPNRVKSTPSRYEKGDIAGGSRSFGTPAEQQAARDAQVVDTLKGAGFKVDDIIYAPPAPRP